MADPIREYLDALKACEQERLKARKLITLVCQVANVIQYNLADFAASAYGLALPAGGRDRFRAGETTAPVDMSEWPDAEALQLALTNWHAAFLRLRDAWDAIPEDDQKGMREPPPTLLIG
jgi:hypothetical protein